MRAGRMTKITCIAALLILAAGPVTTAQAQSGQCGVERKVEARALNELTWKQLNRVYEEVGEENFSSAYDDLQTM